MKPVRAWVRCSPTAPIAAMNYGMLRERRVASLPLMACSTSNRASIHCTASSAPTCSPRHFLRAALATSASSKNLRLAWAATTEAITPGPRHDVERGRRLRDRLTIPAGILLAQGLDFLPGARDHLQRLSDVLAQLGQPAAATGRARHG